MSSDIKRRDAPVSAHEVVVSGEGEDEGEPVREPPDQKRDERETQAAPPPGRACAAGAVLAASTRLLASSSAHFAGGWRNPSTAFTNMSG